MAWQEREVNPSRSARHFYGAETRRLRSERGWALAKLAAEVHYSPSTLSRVENGDIKVPLGLSEELDRVFETGGFFVRLLPLARQEAHPAKYQEILATADQAVSYESYSPMVHGLLQTPAHARRLLRAGDPFASEEEVEELVRARIGRQLRLHSQECKYWFILDESAIRRVVGNRAEMAEQLRAILEIAEQPNVIVQVLPFAAGAHSEYAAMSLLTLQDGQQIAYEESSRAGMIFDETQDVGKRQSLYNLLRARALSPEDTELLIRSALEGLAPMQPNDSRTSTEQHQWRKSSYSNGDGGECIEVDDAHPGHVRDSKDPSGPVLAFAPADWAAFVTATASGEFGNV